MSITAPPPKSREVLKLKRPMSVAIYDDYADAARAVDYLADRQFPVENLAIVGTDLKSVEKVTGNVTWGKILLAGFLQGAMWAGMFAVFMWLLTPQLNLLNTLAMGIAGFGLVGMAMAALQYRMRGGERDYTSTTAIIATHYEVLAEAEVVDRARSLLSGGSAHQTREIAAASPAQSAGAAPGSQGVDLAAFPPPFGQRPAAEAPNDTGAQRAWPGLDQQAPPPLPVPQPSAGALAAAPPVGDQPAPESPVSAGNTPYGQYWGEGEPQGIGNAPTGDVPTGFERPRRTDESAQ